MNGGIYMAASKTIKPNKIAKYFKEVWVELKKVTWPSKSQLIKHTITVLTACLIIGSIIWIADLIFTYLAGLFYN
jgi:preprotein translocase subunit SecE